MASIISTRLSSLRFIGLCAISIALTAASAQIAIPIPHIPITLQVFAVLLSGALLGSRLGALSQFGYLAVGILGAPVFASFRGGPGIFLAPSFGYALAFPISAAISGLFEPKGNAFARSPAPLLLGLAPIYIFGTLYLYFLAPIALGKNISIATTAKLGVLPFIAPDILKAMLAWFIARRLASAVRRAYPPKNLSTATASDDLERHK